ncbi:small integral membrane protein 14 isoform X2 [Penaeus vannamei]|uniref:Small integral membrane protein 14 n=2 Tax=Penaeus vannamei TaxID=6689 RepID=A0A3R7MCK9_PENVA|nr:small integral membrane protein 14-like [Penaeus vannamei]XP_027209839.1 small integral membrane protein 14-like [Penaeus vannamei]XP_027209840.1 small integral membrane protein 14-like [Penaeus vannamei]ROT78272.1 putative small integral membrane protein 14 [Penaeus vannamei]
MADEGFDPCECIWSHEMAMRRLLSLLRQSQTYCTDNECFNEMPGPTMPARDTGSDSMMFLAMMWGLLAIVLFFLRPSSLRSNPDAKPSNSHQDGGSPPAPPTAN